PSGRARAAPAGRPGAAGPRFARLAGMRITVLAGGVGAARFLRGLKSAAPDAEITVIGNTGDDITLFGLHVSPDLDTVMYTLGGASTRSRAGAAPATPTPSWRNCPRTAPGRTGSAWATGTSPPIFTGPACSA